jgi:hypothetical protein
MTIHLSYRATWFATGFFNFVRRLRSMPRSAPVFGHETAKRQFNAITPGKASIQRPQRASGGRGNGARKGTGGDKFCPRSWNACNSTQVSVDYLFIRA